MKFKADREQVVGAIARAAAITSTAGVLGVLSCVKMSIYGNTLRLEATNLEVTIFDSVVVEGEQDGEVAVDAKRILGLLRALGGEEVSVSAREGVLHLDGRGRSSLPTASADLFPTTVRGEGGAEVDAAPFLKALGVVSHAISTGHDRPILTCAHVDTNKGGKVRVTATDGHRLATVELDEAVSVPPFLLQRRAIDVIKRSFEMSGKILIHLTDGQVTLSQGQVAIVARLIEGVFPDFEAVIPVDRFVRAGVGGGDLTAALKLAALTSGKTRKVTLTVHAE